MALVVKNPPANAGDMGEGSANPPQYSCLENPEESHRGGWWVTVYEIAKSQTQLSTQEGKYHKIRPGHLLGCGGVAEVLAPDFKQLLRAPAHSQDLNPSPPVFKASTLTTEEMLLNANKPSLSNLVPRDGVLFLMKGVEEVEKKVGKQSETYTKEEVMSMQPKLENWSQLCAFTQSGKMSNQVSKQRYFKK